MCVDVNEARRYDQPRYFNDPIRGDIRQLADGDDGVAAQGDICSECRLAAPVNDQPAFQYDIGAKDVCCHVSF
jgi:hypothetical protein